MVCYCCPRGADRRRHCLRLWKACAASLGLSPGKLYALAGAITTQPSSTAGNGEHGEEDTSTALDVDVPTSVGAYVLLAAHLAASPVAAAPSPVPRPATALRDLFPLVHLGLAGTGTEGHISTDATLFWLWTLTSRAIAAQEPLDDGQVDALVPLLTPLAALSPSPATRFLAFRLVAALVLRLPISAEARFVLLAELAGPGCPYVGMRVAAVGLVREALAAALAAARPSKLLSPALVAELGDVLFRLEPEDLLDSPGGVGLEGWLAEHHRGTLEKLGLYYFLLARDEDNKASPSPSANPAGPGRYARPPR